MSIPKADTVNIMAGKSMITAAPILVLKYDTAAIHPLKEREREKLKRLGFSPIKPMHDFFFLNCMKPSQSIEFEYRHTTFLKKRIFVFELCVCIGTAREIRKRGASKMAHNYFKTLMV